MTNLESKSNGDYETDDVKTIRDEEIRADRESDKINSSSQRPVRRTLRGYVTPNKARALRILSQAGICYRTDFIKYLAYTMKGNTSSAVRILKSLEKDGDVISYEVLKDAGSKPGDTYAVIKLTAYGRSQAIEMAEGTEYYEYLKNSTDEIEKSTHRSDPVYIRRWCHDARIMLMFEAAGVRTFESEKPSLEYLYGTIAGVIEHENKNEFSGRYRDSLSLAECRQALDDGIYYTIAEFRDFITRYSSKDADIIYATRARGIFVSSKTMFIVYASRRGNERMIKFQGSEQRILDAVKRLASITDVERAIPSMSRMELTSTGQLAVKSKYVHHVSALLISDNDAIVYAMSSARAHGIKKEDKSTRRKNFTYKANLLDVNCSLYDRIFVTPCTTAGMDALAYLCSTSVEEYQQYAVDLLSHDSQFTRNISDPLYLYSENTTPPSPAIYLPAYEIKELAEIAKLKGSVTIVTYPDMFETIAHSIHKKARYYNTDDMSLVPDAFIGIYDETGRLAGYTILLNALKEKGYKNAHNELIGLPRRFGMEQAEFFNDVAEGRITVDEVMKSIRKENLEPDIPVLPVPKQKKSSITIKVTEDIMADIKKAARGCNVSPTRYIHDLVMSHTDEIKADASAHRERLKEIREVWKQ